MSQDYKSSLSNVLEGNTNAAADFSFQQRSEWQKTADEAIEAQLISTRLAIKAGNLQQISVESLDESRTTNAYLKAEILFVKATHYAQSSLHLQAAKAYTEAAVFYRAAQRFDREALSRFNNFIALTYGSTMSLEEENLRLDQIIELCQNHQVLTTEFLCHRHRSFRLYEEKEYQKAIECLIIWLGRKEAIAKSDSELAILHIADCYFEMNDLRKAISYFDQVPESVDERVRFPKALMEAKIFRKEIDIESFPMVTSHWRERFQKTLVVVKAAKKKDLPFNTMLWSFKAGIISENRSIKAKIKVQSLEGQLLRLLMDESRSKASLCESLWPSDMDTEFLDNRFHQLVQRINRKLKAMIIFDGHHYKLSKKLQQL